jgi:site-specific DNA-methyltransferase (adenine-specific)
MVDAALFSSASYEWETPQELFDQLDEIFHFTLDVCATTLNAKCEEYFYRTINGLSQSWDNNICWMNPPYGDPEYPCKPNCKKKKCQERGYHISEYVPGIRDWVEKAYKESRSPFCIVVALLPARTDTKWFQGYVWDKDKGLFGDWRDGVKGQFIKGRLKFGNAKNSAPFPSMIVVFRGS